jgi:hypothetical protein
MEASAERLARRQFSGAQTLGSVKKSVQALPIVIWSRRPGGFFFESIFID